MNTHYCSHGHTYLQHHNCYLSEKPEEQRIGFYDIEASNLDADFGFILSYSIKSAGEDLYYEDHVTPKDLKTAKPGDEDRRVVSELVDDLQQFDIVVGYYSKRFDMPFIRARALITKLPFPEFGTLKHIDLYDTMRHKFKLSSNRLENACRQILGDTNKTRIDGKYWRAAGRGDVDSMEYIIDHNRHDVDDLERLYNAVINFSRKNEQSI
jgi:uncharacterized protein YprB with RNaseH-like and TPR domain